MPLGEVMGLLGLILNLLKDLVALSGIEKWMKYSSAVLSIVFLSRIGDHKLLQWGFVLFCESNCFITLLNVQVTEALHTQPYYTRDIDLFQGMFT